MLFLHKQKTMRQLKLQPMLLNMLMKRLLMLLNMLMTQQPMLNMLLMLLKALQKMQRMMLLSIQKSTQPSKLTLFSRNRACHRSGQAFSLSLPRRQGTTQTYETVRPHPECH